MIIVGFGGSAVSNGCMLKGKSETCVNELCPSIGTKAGFVIPE